MCMESAFNHGTSCFKPINILVGGTALRAEFPAFEHLLWQAHIDAGDPADILSHWQAVFIGLEYGSQGKWWIGNHVGVLDRYNQDIVVQAEKRGVTRTYLSESLPYDGKIFRFRHEPELTNEEASKGRAFLDTIVGRPYDWLLLSERIVIAMAKLLGPYISVPIVNVIGMLSPVDFAGIKALICYEVNARFGNATGRWKANPATFGPLEIWKFQQKGDLVLIGEATLHSEPVEEPPH